MKNLIIASSIFFVACSQENKSIQDIVSQTVVKNGISTSTFKVWGNCGMCEDKIEGSLKVNGVKEADWNSDTKNMEVSYDSTIITLDEIQRKIAATGYDTQNYKSSDSIYSNLHECCQYKRDK